MKTIKELNEEEIKEAIEMYLESKGAKVKVSPSYALDGGSKPLIRLYQCGDPKSNDPRERTSIKAECEVESWTKEK